jgi:homoserine O-acetyltransferase
MVREVTLCIVTIAACSASSLGAQEVDPAKKALLLDPSNPAWSEKAPAVFHAKFETSEGDFVIEVLREWAPHGADRFYNLVRNGFYDDARIHRVVAGRFAQFGLNGDRAVTAAWKGKFIPDDSVRTSNVRGTIAYAFAVPNSRLSQVYISTGDMTRQDTQGFAPFGRVIEGMDVVDKFYSGYGENSGGGIRAGRQGPVEQGGNAYLDREYPLLTRIRRASILPQ